MSNRYSGEIPQRGSYLRHLTFSPRLLPTLQVPVGYGGLIYDITNIGNIIALQVLPATNATSTTSTAGQNSTSGAG
ncbi:MAG: hypothetical protein ACRD5J_08540 [Nitrososphaeraceae archaeon]